MSVYNAISVDLFVTNTPFCFSSFRFLLREFSQLLFKVVADRIEILVVHRLLGSQTFLPVTPLLLTHHEVVHQCLVQKVIQVVVYEFLQPMRRKHAPGLSLTV